MNAAFLDRYCTYHLEDIGMLSPTNLLDFKGYCTEFSEDIKELDRELYRDVMTMSQPKQVNLIRDIHNLNIQTVEERLDTLVDIDLELSEIIREEILISESAITDKLKSIPDKLISWFSNKLKLLARDFKANSPAIATTFLILFGLGGVGLGLFGVVGPIVQIMLATLLVVLPFMSFGKNQISLIDILTSQLTKLRYSRGLIDDNIQLLLRSDMKSCLNSNISTETNKITKDIIIYNLFTRNREDQPGFTPAEIASDKLLECSLTYLTNTIAEMYSSLSSCQTATRKNKPSPSSFTTLSPELSKLDLAPECQSIRDTLDKYVIYYNTLLDLAFTHDTTAKRYWKHTLDEHIKLVMGGRHANPVNNASRGVPKKFSKVKFKFDRNAKK